MKKLLILSLISALAATAGTMHAMRKQEVAEGQAIKDDSRKLRIYNSSGQEVLVVGSKAPGTQLTLGFHVAPGYTTPEISLESMEPILFQTKEGMFTVTPAFNADNAFICILALKGFGASQRKYTPITEETMVSVLPDGSASFVGGRESVEVIKEFVSKN